MGPNEMDLLAAATRLLLTPRREDLILGVVSSGGPIDLVNRAAKSKVGGTESRWPAKR